ncbi:MAG: S41 family peptidase [Candidatus Sumerlaeia bacterium]
MKNIRGMLKLEGGLLLIGLMLLSACTYMLATVDQRVRAVDKIEEGEYNEDYYRFAELMAEIFVQVQNRYVDEVEPQRIFQAALDGVFDALDPHSSYLSADNFKDLEKSTEGEFSGIGIHIDVRNGILTVISPIPGTPAAREGLQAWDRIVEIEGESTEGITTSEAVEKLTGPVGTEVSIMVYRESTRKRIPFTIVRDRIKIQSVYSNADAGDYVPPYFKALLDEGIGYVRLTKFSENVSDDLEKALERLKEANVRGLIIDGRFNSGGLLDEGIKVSDLFLEDDAIIVATKGRLEEQNKVYRARESMKVKWPILMLVNEGSASATEILAGALKDHHRAVLLGPEGQNTYGKAMVQSITPLRVSLEKDEEGNDLPNALRLTTARYYTPDNVGEDGKSIHDIGIKPDLTVKIPAEHYSDLLTKGMLLGDPILAEPGEEKDEKAAGENGDDDGNDKESDDEDEADEDDEPKEGGDIPFYMKNGEEENKPTTKDIQLRYGVDVLRALLISNYEKS